MEFEFTKMQGAGNDFVLLDGRVGLPDLDAAMLARLADRRRGIGCDQVLLLEPAGREDEDAALRFFNADGSESAACGNGTRCVAAWLAGQTGRDRVRLRSRAGLLEAEIAADGAVRVDMGPVRLDWREVPLARVADTRRLDLPGAPAACSIGNPHATLFVADLNEVELARAGAALEWDPLFPEGANIGFAQVIDTASMRLAVWERGSGATPACGSGACAAAVNAHRRGLVGRDCLVTMPGGTLHVTWREDGHVLLGGPVATVFTGRIGLAP